MEDKELLNQTWSSLLTTQTLFKGNFLLPLKIDDNNNPTPMFREDLQIEQKNNSEISIHY